MWINHLDFTYFQTFIMKIEWIQQEPEHESVHFWTCVLSLSLFYTWYQLNYISYSCFVKAIEVFVSLSWFAKNGESLGNILDSDILTDCKYFNYGCRVLCVFVFFLGIEKGILFAWYYNTGNFLVFHLENESEDKISIWSGGSVVYFRITWCNVANQCWLT